LPICSKITNATVKMQFEIRSQRFLICPHTIKMASLFEECVIQFVVGSTEDSP
jgi:hypothetical protein